MKLKSVLPSIALGVGMFSLFFGAGNTTFPLQLGMMMGESTPLALLGLIITAVLLPFLGLLVIALFQGDSSQFFAKIGTLPGRIMSAILLLIIGPLGGIPRCINLTYSTLSLYFHGLPFIMFVIVSCFLLLLLAIDKGKTIDVISYLLAPALTLILGIVIIKGCIHGDSLPLMGGGANPLSYGILRGYQTMDLIAGLFFAQLLCQRCLHQGNIQWSRVCVAMLCGVSLLSIVYIGFGALGKKYAGKLLSIPTDQLLGKVGTLSLGGTGGLMISCLVSLACLTTALALVLICSRWLQETWKGQELHNLPALLLILSPSGLIALLKFEGIEK
ncbi:MAG: branched-chain amino acid transport system II carrier protein, partial [Chlamydiota bacterium]|nr:branched-chain amino acid transport system II carrier protein [Chlamydiota bacterium]